MITHRSSDDRFVFHHDGDHSGDVRVVVPTEVTKEIGANHIEITIPDHVLIEYSRRATINEVISKLEDMQ